MDKARSEIFYEEHAQDQFKPLDLHTLGLESKLAQTPTSPEGFLQGTIPIIMGRLPARTSGFKFDGKTVLVRLEQGDTGTRLRIFGSAKPGTDLAKLVRQLRL